MKRHRPSGAEGRKIKKKREEEAKSLSGALLKFIQPTKNPGSSKCDEEEVSNDIETTSERSQEDKEGKGKEDLNAEVFNDVELENITKESCEIKDDLVITKESDKEKKIEEVKENILESLEEKHQDFKNCDEVDKTNFYSDIGDWPFPLPDDLRIEFLKRGSESFQNKDGPFNVVQRQGEKTKGQSRQLTTNWFYKYLPNGERILRKWMIYSPTKKMLFCFCCRLFSTDFKESGTSKFVSGFDKWWKLNPKVPHHEYSEEHLTSLEKWKTLAAQLKSKSTVDALYQQEQDLQRKTWRDVLHRLLDITLFLSKQNLPFRGHRESEVSENRGNFLQLVDLLSHYDPVLKEHLVRIQQSSGPSKKLLITYLSAKTQNEFISILGATVKNKILEDIKNAKYFGILFDSTPDVSHSDQMSEVIRYVHIEMGKVEIRESFLGFFSLSGKKAHDITQEILETIEQDGLDIQMCRSQGYDNASTMAGVHTGVQARILGINPKALFVPCANHSLNLCGVHAFATIPSSITFIGTLESIYKFFSVSTHRWDVLLEVVGVSVKRLCETRWSAYHDAVKSVMVNFPKIVQAVEKLCDPSENIDTRCEGGILLKTICDFSFLSYLFLWAHVLEEINHTQKYLQIEGITLDKSLKKMQTLKLFFDESRVELPDNALLFAEQTCEELNVPVQRAGRRKFKIVMPGEKAKDVGLTLHEELKRSMLECMDRFTQELKTRMKSMETICSTFSIIEPHNVITATDDTLRELVTNLSEKMDELEEEAIVPEIKRLRRHLHAASITEDVSKKWSSLQMLQFVVDLDFQESVPNIFLALKFFLTACVSISSCERSFSKLKLIKSYLRSTMSQTRLNSLAILSIEKSVTKTIDFNDVINKFAEAKVRKVRI